MSQQADETNREGNAFDDFDSLMKYVMVLLRSYPKPISHEELAKELDYTPAAISKVKDKLLELCDKPIYAFKRKFLLSLEQETVVSVFIQFFFRGEVEMVIGNQYLRDALKKAGIH